MSATGKIIVISGTNRPDSFTRRCVRILEDELNSKKISFALVDGVNTPLNFPGQDPTKEGAAMKEMVSSCSGIIWATPEYHGSFSAYTKLAIENLGFPSVMKGKPIALLGVAAGRIGAIKSLESLRGCLSHTGALVLPSAVSIAGVRGAFGGDKCTDEATEKAVRGVVNNMQTYINNFVCPKLILEEMIRGKDDDKPWVSNV